MPRNLRWSARIFQIALAVVLFAGVGAGLAWHHAWTQWTWRCSTAIVVSAAVAVAARVWQLWAEQPRPTRDFQAGPANYRLRSFS